MLSNLKNIYQKNKLPMVLVAIILGQASLECRRFGICKMKRIKEEEELLSIDFDCLAYLSCLHEGGLQLQFLQEWITDPIYDRYFSRGTFQVNESFKIPRKICLLLGCKNSLIIPAGHYPIFDNTLRIELLHEIAA